MSRAFRISTFAMVRTPLKLHQPPERQPNTNRWRINGHGATITIWTAEEWDRLKDRPTDAQYYPCGIWCALRLD